MVHVHVHVRDAHHEPERSRTRPNVTPPQYPRHAGLATLRVQRAIETALPAERKGLLSGEQRCLVGCVDERSALG